MRSPFRFISILLLLLPLTVLAGEPAVKMSSSGICHDESSAWYSRTKNFTPFDTVDSCVKAGGRPPKSYTPDNSSGVAPDKPNRFMPAGTTIPYDRSAYNHWIDTDRDCQNVRHELLIATSKAPVTFTNWRKCTVKTGQWYDLYTDKTYTLASDLDIDHVVPLAYAHYRGASAWSSQRKEDFANDPDNLLAVRDIDNQRKSAQGPSTWMPANQAYRCDYLAHFMRVMDKYRLILKSGEKRIIDRMQGACR
jgi:hypothetical protein